MLPLWGSSRLWPGEGGFAFVTKPPPSRFARHLPQWGRIWAA